ncbi:MAG: hypothetical protein EON89_09980 [Brevundimonas sp.]|nr:MAG: hypothetical protein EON89_09980 [Brevundimonas sp.]
MTTLFGTVWARSAATSTSAPTYTRMPRLLGLNYASDEDRFPFSGVSNLVHTHNCSSVLGLAIEANGELRLGPAEIRQALQSTYQNTTKDSVSLVNGRFYSPVPVVLGLAPQVQRPNLDSFATHMAVWAWYAANPARVGQGNYVIEQLDGIARYKFSGLTMETRSQANGGVSAGLIGFNASLTGSGTISAQGSTSVNGFEIVRYADPAAMTMAELPPLATVVSNISDTARFTLDDSSFAGPIVNTSPFRLSYTIGGIPIALCNRARWNPGANVQNVSVVPVTDAGGQAAQACRFAADFTPPAAPDDSGFMAAQFTMTTAFPTSSPAVSGGDLTLKVPAVAEAIPDGRARTTLQYFDGALRPAAGGTADQAHIVGTARYRIIERGVTRVSGVGSAPRITMTCGGSEPKAVLAQAKFTAAQGGIGQPAEVLIDILESDIALPAGTPEVSTCVLTGEVELAIGGTQSLVRVLPGRTFPNVQMRAASPAPVQQRTVLLP